MNSCGYYSCFKGKVSCKHPRYGEEKSKIMSERNNTCDWCRRICGGIYPSQLPREDISNCKIDVLDMYGRVIIEIQ